MAVFIPSRKNVVLLIFIGLFFLIIFQLANLQLFSSKYRLAADDQGIFKKVIYPDRGIVYDRNGKVLLQNTTIYDLMVIPGKLKGIDTFTLCNILKIDTAEYKKRVLNSILKNKSFRPSVFEALLSNEKMALLNESMYKFEPGFYLQERSVRDLKEKYPDMNISVVPGIVSIFSFASKVGW